MTNEDWAHRIIAAYIEGARSGRYVWTYGDMASATGRQGQHRLMGPALDLVGDICEGRGLPDCSTMIVTKPNLMSGTIEPSAAALEKHSGWSQLRRQQAACLTFDWVGTT